MEILMETQSLQTAQDDEGLLEGGQINLQPETEPTFSETQSHLTRQYLDFIECAQLIVSTGEKLPPMTLTLFDSKFEFDGQSTPTVNPLVQQFLIENQISSKNYFESIGLVALQDVLETVSFEDEFEYGEARILSGDQIDNIAYRFESHFYKYKDQALAKEELVLRVFTIDRDQDVPEQPAQQ